MLRKVPIDIYIAGNNRPPIGIGSYRLPIDLEPVVQGRYTSLQAAYYTGRSFLVSQNLIYDGIGSMLIIYNLLFQWFEIIIAGSHTPDRSYVTE